VSFALERLGASAGAGLLQPISFSVRYRGQAAFAVRNDFRLFLQETARASLRRASASAMGPLVSVKKRRSVESPIVKKLFSFSS